MNVFVLKLVNFALKINTYVKEKRKKKIMFEQQILSKIFED